MKSDRLYADGSTGILMIVCKMELTGIILMLQVI